MKIGVFAAEPWEKPLFISSFHSDTVVFSAQELTPVNAAKYKDLELACVFVHSQINQKTLSSMPKLKYVVTRSTGFDHIDLTACKERGIAVCNVPTYGENTVAEFTFALLLALSRHIIHAVEATTKKHKDFIELRGFDLAGKTLGVVGCGNIGRHVVRIARGFGMNVVVFDVCPDKAFAKQMGFRYLTLEKLLSSSDIVTLHVPYNAHTRHLLDKKRFSLMKKGAYLVNTSRGGVVDSDALISALKSKKLAGAALDVLEHEENMAGKNQILLKMPNVLVTPHNAFNSQEAMQRILETTIENIKRIKKGKVVNRVG